MNAIYDHTQIGYISIVAAVVILISFGWRLRHKSDAKDDLATNGKSDSAIKLVLAFTLLITTMFVSLTIRVDPRQVSWSFGPGLIRGSVAVTDIVAARPVAMSSTGWGIRKTPSGWRYNVSGDRSVELDLRDGRQIDPGTDDTNALMSALRTVLGAERAK